MIKPISKRYSGERVFSHILKYNTTMMVGSTQMIKPISKRCFEERVFSHILKCNTTVMVGSTDDKTHFKKVLCREGHSLMHTSITVVYVNMQAPVAYRISSQHRTLRTRQ